MTNLSGSSTLQHPKLPHLEVLDGLRGVAIILVVAVHYQPLFRIGWVGVDLFFVLSGFLITGRLVQTTGKKGYFSVFYRNRALRIFPLYYAVLLIFFLGVACLVSPANMPRLLFYTNHWLSFFVFMQNWSMIHFGFPKEVYLVHFWSLAVEEQFYVVWPVLIFFCRNRKKLIAGLSLWVIAVIAYRIYLYYSDPTGNDIMHNSICRSDSLVIGGLAFLVYDKKHEQEGKWTAYAMGLSCILLLLGIVLSRSARFDSYFFSTIGYTIIAVLFASIVLRSIRYGEGRFSGWLRNATLRYFGKISYGIYIFHLPVLLILGSHLRNMLINHMHWAEQPASFVSLICSVLACLTISALSYRYYESYFLRLKKQAA